MARPSYYTCPLPCIKLGQTPMYFLSEVIQWAKDNCRPQPHLTEKE